MYVVRGATESESINSAISSNAAEVTPKLIGFGDSWPAVFRTEDAVHQDFGVGVGHAETLFAGVIGVGDSSHTRECARSAAQDVVTMQRGLTPPPKPIPPLRG